MKISFLKIITLGLIAASAFLLSACNKKTDTAAIRGEVTIPDNPDAAIQTVISEFAKGNSGIVWEALPASYQSDVNGLMHLAGSKMDKEIYDKSFALFARLAEVINEQKPFILNSSFMQEQPAENLSQLEASLPSITGFMNTIASSEIGSIEGLLNFDGQVFFDTTVSKCVEYIESVGQLAGEEAKLSDYAATIVSVVEADEQQATLLVTVPGQEAQELVFTKVEQRWVPVEIASEWTKNITEATTSLEATSSEEFAAQKTQIMGALTMIDGVLTKIASAETQEQFDQSLKEATMPFMGIMMMLSQGMSE